MPFWRTYYHIVWATKERLPLLTEKVESALYSYLEYKARELQVRTYAIDGCRDHVHLVVSIPPKHSVASVVKVLKGSSSHHINTLAISDGAFSWQRGYGVLTVGERQLEKAIAYVERQKEHHREQTTNSWLEHTNQFDEGPPTPDNTTMREPAPIYTISNPDPFPF
jgi:REP element-mobilizing transposase RayT